jgi:glycosyltransferase involved in cell wall biosynthesis
MSNSLSLNGKNPFFSIVIPLYNKEKYIKRAVDSVLEQDFDSFELIVVDDGSSDSSAKIASHSNDPRLRLVRKENQGEGLARNTGIDESIGKWIVFLDADDMWLEKHLSIIKEIIDTFEDVGMVSNVSVERESSSSIEHLPQCLKYEIKKIDYFLEAAKNIGVVNSSSSAIRRDVYDKKSGFTADKMGCDLEHWARVALDYPVAVSTAKTAIYFRGTGGVMETSALNTKDKKSIIPSHLSNISPSVKMLGNWLNFENGLNSDLQRPVMIYINSRLNSSVRGALINSDLEKIKALRKLYFLEVVKLSNFYYFISTLPVPVIKSIALFRYTIKNVYLKFRSK